MLKPNTLNDTAIATIETLLYKGSYYGEEVNKDWLSGILRDCLYRNSRPNLVNEPLIFHDKIFYGLAGVDNVGLFKRVAADPSEFSDNNDVAYSRIAQIFGDGSIEQIMTYQIIRDNLQYLQVTSFISSLEPRLYTIRDRLFQTLKYDSQLIILEDDRVLLADAVPQVVEYFQKTIEDYLLFSCNDNNEYIPFTGSLTELSNGAEYAWVYPESYEWVQQANGQIIGHSVNKFDPDSIELLLERWNFETNDFALFKKVVAKHKNQFI